MQRHALHQRIIKYALKGGHSLLSNRPLITNSKHGMKLKEAFLVVGVPGSGKDTWLKKCIQQQLPGVQIADINADEIKAFLALWGKDRLSMLVQQNERENGPGRQLL